MTDLEKVKLLFDELDIAYGVHTANDNEINLFVYMSNVNMMFDFISEKFLRLDIDY